MITHNVAPLCANVPSSIKVPIPYIRLITRHVFSTNSTLKTCIKSTRVNISQNHSKSLNVPDMQKTVKFTRMHFSRPLMIQQEPFDPKRSIVLKALY